MEIDRRALLTGLGAATVLWTGQALAMEAALNFVGAYRAPDGRSGVALIDADGRLIRMLPLPGRGHDATVSAVTGDCVVFARRPGNFALAFSTRRERQPHAFTTVSDRHFYGHGVFSVDGRLLYATENAFEEGAGKIGVYDAHAGYRRIGEFPSYGVGPHDIALLPGEPVLVVANGGMREHPGVGGGRDIINFGALEPSIAYVDTRTGDLLELQWPESTSGALSLRHLDVAPDGTVVIGCQTEESPEREPLIFRHRRQQALVPLDIAEDTHALFRGYISSVAIDCGGTFAAVTSSRTGTAAVIDIASGRLQRRVQLTDVSGVAATPTAGSFIYTSGTGDIAIEPRRDDISRSRSPIGWDNHLTSFRPA